MVKKRKGNSKRDGKTNRRKADFDDDKSTGSFIPPVKGLAKPLDPMNRTQGQYMSQIENKDIVFGIGPAGTGKTYISARMAAQRLKSGDIEKIVIVRPMVGCDEDMGHLPGEIDDKFAPWLEPFFDALTDELGSGFLSYCLKSKKIEPKPLQFMRGKSFRDSWILLDEAQNTTPEQMKMFLTRIGEGCKMVISGDVTQHDRRNYRNEKVENGLSDAVNRVRDVSEIGVIEFDIEDVVRHHLVGKIISKYQ